jgi:hypothetical protein
MNGTVEVIAVHTVECAGEVHRPGAKFLLPAHALSDLLRLGSVRQVHEMVEPAIVEAPTPKTKRRYTRRKKG